MHIPHLISMMLGSSECIHVVNGRMVIGQWQSVLMVDLDGPKGTNWGCTVYGIWVGIRKGEKEGRQLG